MIRKFTLYIHKVFLDNLIKQNYVVDTNKVEDEKLNPSI